MNRTERARKKALRDWQEKARSYRNSKLFELKDCAENFEAGGDPSIMRECFFRDESQNQLSKVQKSIKKKLKAEKVAVINSHKEKIRA